MILPVKIRLMSNNGTLGSRFKQTKYQLYRRVRRLSVLLEKRKFNIIKI
jgi:hypothetical protein